MRPTFMYSRMVEPHEKSITLGGALTLFPLPEAVVRGHARIIAQAIERAERAAYIEGKRDAKQEIREVLGVTP